MKYRCTMCGEIYDEEKSGVKFKDLPESWVCPVCGAPKSLFEPVAEAPAMDAAGNEAVANVAPVADPLDAVSYIQAVAENGEIPIGSAEGGIFEKEREIAPAFIFEYVPNKYSVTDENLRRADAIDIKIGQAAKPGLGGHLPGAKVTAEIAAMRGFPEGEDIISPPAFPEINSAEDLKALVSELRERSEGRPIGIKIAANDIEGDLEWIRIAEPDYITIDGRGGGTGAAPSLWKETAGVPTLYALVRARKYLDEHKMSQELIITGGLRTAADIAKCLALGANAVALATGALTAVAAPAEIEKSEKVANYLSGTLAELKMYARACGLSDLRDFSLKNLATTSETVCNHTPIRHVGL